MTRPTFNVNEENESIKQEGDERSLTKNGQGVVDLPKILREAFHRYIMDDWRRRIDIAIA